ncbi:MAG: glycosyltransferase family 2 protein [Bacteroidales bacterium]
MNRPRVSVISVNYNQPDVTCDMLASLRQVTYPDVEVIVVDNGSSVPCNRISREFPEVKLIKSAENLGFAGGNNLGIDQATGKYLLFLNNDTEVEPGFLEPLVELLEDNPDIGMVSPKIKFYHHRELIQYAGYSRLNIRTLRMKGLGYGRKDDGSFDRITETHFAHGAAMMVPRRVIDKVGKMPDIYFLYYEEHDWCIRVKRAGFKVYYHPQSVVWHKESVSTGRNSALQTYYMTRNRILFGRRNIAGLPSKLSAAYMILIAFPKNLVELMIKRESANLKAYLRAIWWHCEKLFKRFRVPDTRPGAVY